MLKPNPRRCNKNVMVHHFSSVQFISVTVPWNHNNYISEDSRRTTTYTTEHDTMMMMMSIEMPLTQKEKM